MERRATTRTERDAKVRLLLSEALESVQEATALLQPAHDPFTHLCRSLFLGKSDLMAMLTVYCDDSGMHPEGRVAVVAGYLSNVAQWEIFKKEWGQALKAFKVNQMHRADLESSHGEFKGWNPAKRKALLQQLQPIINHRTKMAVGAMVIKEEFETFIPDDIKEKFGGVYGFLAYDCLVGVGQWCNKPSRQHSDPIHWVFEAGTVGSHQVGQMFQATYADEKLRQQSHLGGWSFKGKDTVPLQAADLIAYECFKHIENQVVDKGEKHPVRISMTKLDAPEKSPCLSFFDQPRLEKFVTVWERLYPKEPSS